MEIKKELLAYCGLYCGDCAGYSGEIADAARNLLDLLHKYKFEITAKAYFANTLKGYKDLKDMLQFITTLKCDKICRKKKQDESKCRIRDCCRERGYYACYECKIYEKCEILKKIEDPHGDSYLKNFQAIKSMGIDAWLKEGKRYWFGSDVDDKI